MYIFPTFWHQLLVRVTFSRQFARETFENNSLTQSLEKVLSLTNEQENPFDESQKKWTQPVYVKTAVFKMKHTKIEKRYNFLEWMLNVQNFSTLIQAISVLSG